MYLVPLYHGFSLSISNKLCFQTYIIAEWLDSNLANQTQVCVYISPIPKYTLSSDTHAKLKSLTLLKHRQSFRQKAEDNRYSFKVMGKTKRCFVLKQAEETSNCVKSRWFYLRISQVRRRKIIDTPLLNSKIQMLKKWKRERRRKTHPSHKD